MMSKTNSVKRSAGILILSVIILQLQAQNVGISQTGSTPEASSILDVSSTSKGILFPRMTTSQRDAINGGSPASSLVIFNTTENCLQIYITGTWQNVYCDINCSTPPSTPGSISGNTMPCQNASGVTYSIAQVAGATSYTWTVPSGATITAGQGTTNIIVDFGTTNGNVSIVANNACGSSSAQNLAITLNTAPSAPSSGSHTPSKTQIVWNWNSATGATGYKYNAVNNYSTATDNGANLTYTQTGLVCNTPYTLYVWADNGCGESGASTLNETTSSCFTGCIPTATTVVQDVTNTFTGKVWMDRNLGASQVATAFNDANAYGCFYQWGRAAEGHEDRASIATATNATTAVPNLGNTWDGKFITEPTAPNDWLTPQDNTLWQGAGGTNNPCPSGYRLPTNTELDAERLSWVQVPISSTNDRDGAYASPLKLPASGLRTSIDVTSHVGSSGYYWSGTVSGTNANNLNPSPSNASMYANNRANGMSVRCTKN